MSNPRSVLRHSLFILALAVTPGVAPAQGARYPLRPCCQRAAAFLDSMTIALAGYSGILMTEDGGATWTDRYRGPVTLVDIAFASRQTAVAVGLDSGAYGRSGRIVRTTDGGASWTMVNLPNGTLPLSAVAFADSLNGAAVGWTGTLLRTADGGATWQIVVTGTGETLADITFVGSRGWAVGNDVILHTSDAGARWRKEDHRPRRGSNVFNSVSFADERNGVTAGTGLVWVTNDGGRNWRSKVPALMDFAQEASRRGFFTRQDMIYASHFHGVAMPRPGVILATSSTSGGLMAGSFNGGSSFEVIETGVRSGAGTMAWLDGDNGLAVGGGTLLRTRDGGRTWVDMVGSAPALAVNPGGLGGTWTVTVSRPRHGRMACTGGGTVQLSLEHGDTTLTGTMSGWPLSCRRVESDTLRNLIDTRATAVTRTETLEGPVPAAPFSGWTDRRRGVRLRGVAAGKAVRVDADLLSANSMSGQITIGEGFDQVTAEWSARR